MGDAGVVEGCGKRGFAQLTDKITIQDWATAAHRIETFSFADLTTLNLAGIISRFGIDRVDVIDLSGWTTAVQLNLGAGADKITASAFNDTIDGGDGDDSIIGGKSAKHSMKVSILSTPIWRIIR